MQKTLYIHIGSHKTGTTAIQHFLSLNREILKEKGFLYPGKEMAHHNMAKEFQTLSLPEIIQDPNCTSSTYFNEIQKSNMDNIIISSEAFECLESSVDLLKKFLDNKFKVKIIFYVRRQDEKIESMYNASVKNPDIRSTTLFSEYIMDTPITTQNDLMNVSMCCKEFGGLDYNLVLFPWERAFGKENILVRCYEKEQLPFGIFDDFLKVIGLKSNDEYFFPKYKMNPSFNWDLIEIIRLCNLQYKDDIRFHNFLLKNLAVINRGDKEEKQRLLSPKQRLDIIEKYEESNTKVAREYLGRTDGRLFYAPHPDLNEPYELYQGLTVEKVVPIFTQIMFNFEKNIQKQIKAINNQSLKRKIVKKIRKTIKRFGLL